MHDLVNCVLDLLNTKTFPGTIPKLLRKRDLPNLYSGNYVKSVKYDGYRNLLCYINGSVFLVDRSFNINFLGYDRSTRQKNFIFDMENVQGHFVLFDTLYPKNSEWSLMDRIKVIRKFFYNTCNILGYPFEIKTFLKIEEDETPYRHLPDDGLIFTPISGKDSEKVYKLKPRELQTIDFLVGEEKNLYLLDNAGMVEFAKSADVDKACIGKVCEFSISDNGYKFIRVRQDKKQPNYVQTAENIIAEWKDPIIFHSNSERSTLASSLVAV